MHLSDTNFSKVNEHYAQQDLEAIILNALAAGGKDPDRLRIEDLAPIDEFHIRGRSATSELARDLTIDKNMRVLDVGCGLGGASRHLANEFGCHVTGIDLSAEYCRVAAGLTRRLGLDSLVSFQQGNAVALPFPDGSFDIVWTQHAAMNIPDKSGLYRELFRVLKPRGRLALYDILAGPGGEVHFPVPWAREPSISFLLTSQQLLDTLTAAGFEILIWRDATETGRSWFRSMRDKMRQAGLPAFGLQLLLGPEFRLMAHNQVLNLEEDRIALIEAVVRRPCSS
jgi:ubiquinone/menaquinone biosynthesis C-methylase UbiE